MHTRAAPVWSLYNFNCVRSNLCLHSIFRSLVWFVEWLVRRAYSISWVLQQLCRLVYQRYVLNLKFSCITEKYEFVTIGQNLHFEHLLTDWKIVYCVTASDPDANVAWHKFILFYKCQTTASCLFVDGFWGDWNGITIVCILSGESNLFNGPTYCVALFITY